MNNVSEMSQDLASFVGEYIILAEPYELPWGGLNKSYWFYPILITRVTPEHVEFLNNIDPFGNNHKRKKDIEFFRVRKWEIVDKSFHREWNE